MATRDGAASDSIQDGNMDGEVVRLPPSATEPEQERPDRSDVCPTTQNFVDPSRGFNSQPTQVTPARPAHERQKLIGNPNETTQHQDPAQDTSKDVNANVGIEGAPASDASALRGEDEDEDDFYAYVEALEEPVSSANQPNGLPSRLLVGKRIFSLRKSTEAQKRARTARATETNGFTDRYDYLKKYPADPPEEGMEPNARVWRVYLNEVEQFDFDMVDNFKDTVDVMLVFAGLFSAVVTTFVVQASTALQLDYTQVAAAAALEQLALSRAFYSGSPIPDPSPSTLSLDSSTTTATDRWVNGLWFTSLSLSLATALFAVLTKQWIQAYVSPVSGTPRERARIRQYRYLGLEKWHVYGIIGLLPTLLHLSLFLFLAGLAIFLFPLDHTIAKATASIAGSVATIYIFSNLAPVFDSQCPYKTPLSNYALVLLHPLVPKLRASFGLLRTRLQTLRHTCTTRLRIIHQFITTALIEFAWFVVSSSYLPRKLASRLRRFLEPRTMNARSSQRTSASTFIKKVELDDINLISDGIDAEALCWVVTWSSNPSVKAVVVEAAGDLRIGYEEQAKDILRDGGVADAACASLQMFTKWQGGQMELQSGFEHPHLRAALVHFQLGLYVSTESEHFGPYASRTRKCPCTGLPIFPAHRNVGGHPGPYFSLLLEPSRELVRPQHILQSSPLNSHKIVFLLNLRRAALYLRTDSSSRSQVNNIDWPSCQELLAFVQLEPPPVDLFGLWQTTLVSVYLASLVPEVAPISQDSELLFKLLFNHIELGSSELSEDLAVDLSRQSCIEFLAHALKNPTAATDLSSSPVGSQFIEHLSDHFDIHRLWVSDPDKVVIGPHHTVLVALLDHSEKHGASISAELRTLMYRLGYNLCYGLKARHEQRSSDPELDLVPLLSRLLKAALIPPQLSVPHKILRSQIYCLHTVLRDSPSDGLPVLLGVFRHDDGISTLEKVIQRAGSQLDMGCRMLAHESVVLYLKWVFPVGENSVPPLKTDLTPQSDKGPPGGVDSSDHVNYILHHLVQIIEICVACWGRKISRLETDSYPDTLHILRCIVKTQPEASPEWNHAFDELETQGMSLLLGLLNEYWTFEDVEDNLKEILSILRSDLEAAHSPGVQDSLQPEPLLPQSSISAGVGPSLDLGRNAAEDIDHPPTPVESLVSRSTRRLKTAVWGVMSACRVDALIPLHNRTPLQPVRESESAAGDAVEEESLMARRDEEEGLSATVTAEKSKPHELAEK